MNFKKHVEDGEQVLKEIARETDNPDDLAKAGRIFRAVRGCEPECRDFYR